MPLLRLLGPVVIATSVGVIGSGVALAIVGPGPSIWLFAHKAFFVLWLGAMTIHVVAYAPKLPRLLLSRLTAYRLAEQAPPTDHFRAGAVAQALLAPELVARPRCVWPGRARPGLAAGRAPSLPRRRSRTW
jgi:hypothetical protein